MCSSRHDPPCRDFCSCDFPAGGREPFITLYMFWLAGGLISIRQVEPSSWRRHLGSLPVVSYLACVWQPRVHVTSLCPAIAAEVTSVVGVWHLPERRGSHTHRYVVWASNRGVGGFISSGTCSSLSPIWHINKIPKHLRIFHWSPALGGGVQHIDYMHQTSWYRLVSNAAHVVASCTCA